MKHHRPLSVAVFCLCATAASPFAWSQTPAPGSDAASAQADDLTHRGVDLLKKHQWAEAEDLFRQAWALKRSYDIAGNLGLAEAGLGKWRDAAEHLTLAIATFPANGKAAHRDLLREKLASAREHIGGLAIEVDAAGAEVLVDGKSVGTAPLAGEVLVEPGAHVVEAQLAGRGAARGEASVVAGGSASVTLALKGEQAPPPPPLPVKKAWRPGAALLVTGGVLAVGGLAAGIGLTVAANGRSSTADSLRATVGSNSACAGAATSSTSCAALLSDLQSRDSLTKGAFASFMLGGAFALATAGFGVWTATASKDQKDAPAIRVVPVVGRDDGGLIVLGSF